MSARVLPFRREQWVDTLAAANADLAALNREVMHERDIRPDAMTRALSAAYEIERWIESWRLGEGIDGHVLSTWALLRALQRLERAKEIREAIVANAKPLSVLPLSAATIRRLRQRASG